MESGFPTPVNTEKGNRSMERKKYVGSDAAGWTAPPPGYVSILVSNQLETNVYLNYHTARSGERNGARSTFHHHLSLNIAYLSHFEFREQRVSAMSEYIEGPKSDTKHNKRKERKKKLNSDRPSSSESDSNQKAGTVGRVRGVQEVRENVGSVRLPRWTMDRKTTRQASMSRS